MRGRQGRLVLAYLVLHRERPVRRDELLEAISPREGAAVSATRRDLRAARLARSACGAAAPALARPA